MSLQINDRIVWPNGKHKAATFSFDDGVEQDIRFIDILDRYGAKCTFNLNPGLFGRKGSVAAGGPAVAHNKLSAEQVLTVYSGHELANHGMYHIRLDMTDGARVAKEVLDCRTQLESLREEIVTGFAYSFGAYDDTVLSTLKTCGISYARTIESTLRFDIPTDFLKWNPTCHYRDSRVLDLADQFLSGDTRRIFHLTRLFYVWGHTYEFDQHNDWELAEKIVKKVAKDDVWLATNGEICRYVNAFRQLVFSVDGKRVFNPSCIPIWIGGNFTEESVVVGPGETRQLLPAREV